MLGAVEEHPTPDAETTDGDADRGHRPKSFSSLQILGMTAFPFVFLVTCYEVMTVMSSYPFSRGNQRQLKQPCAVACGVAAGRMR